MKYYVIHEKENGFYGCGKDHNFHTEKNAIDFFKKNGNKFYTFIGDDEVKREEIENKTFTEFVKEIIAKTPNNTTLYVNEVRTIDFDD